MLTFNDVLKQRKSIRDFENKEVPEYLINRVLECALKSPSSSNTQPYKVAIARGDTRDSIRRELTKKFVDASRIQRMPLPKKIFHGALGSLFGGVLPDGDFKTDTNYSKELKQRAVKCGMGLYDKLGIARDDYVSRQNQMRRNFELFDAPVAIFVFVQSDKEVFSSLDAGMFMQSLMLAATAEGLGTCAQGSLATWASPVRKHFSIDKDYKLICGLSLGYPSDHVVNTYQPEKLSIDDICFSERE